MLTNAFDLVESMLIKAGDLAIHMEQALPRVFTARELQGPCHIDHPRDNIVVRSSPGSTRSALRGMNCKIKVTGSMKCRFANLWKYLCQNMTTIEVQIGCACQLSSISFIVTSPALCVEMSLENKNARTAVDQLQSCWFALMSSNTSCITSSWKFLPLN